jgi:prepilin-type N-terminal cleavage/methylation domain-containing protein
MKHASRGMTLVELLIVIAIIGVLAALLFPLFGAARRESKSSVCASNLHQLGLSVQAYTQDWDDHIPYAADPLAKWITGNSTTKKDPLLQLIAAAPYDVRVPLTPYGAIQTLWRCQLDKFPNATPPVKPTFFETCGSSYWYDGPNALKVWSLEDYKNPAQNVIMTDYYPGHLGDDPDGKALNLLYADFHVKNATWNQRNDILTAQGD